MQTLPLDRKSSRESTHEASPPKAPARPRAGGPRELRAGEQTTQLAAILRSFGLTRALPLTERWASPGARVGALTRHMQALGRGLFRVGVEPLAYTAGLLSRLARLLRVSRELMEMGHPPSRNEQSQHPPSLAVRKTHRLAALRRLCRRRERGRVGRTRRSSAMTRNARRVSPRPVRLTNVYVPR